MQTRGSRREYRIRQRYRRRLDEVRRASPRNATGAREYLHYLDRKTVIAKSVMLQEAKSQQLSKL